MVVIFFHIHHSLAAVYATLLRIRAARKSQLITSQTQVAFKTRETRKKNLQRSKTKPANQKKMKPKTLKNLIF